jgi:hypothetical protein
MIYDTYSGDPKIVISGNGADFVYKSGQPVMDQGIENQLTLALFTRRTDPRTGFGWPGNVFLQSLQQLGSDFQDVAADVQTLKSVTIDIPNAISAALADPIFSIKAIDVSNPQSTAVLAQISVGAGNLTIKGNRDTWQAQYFNPASRRL